MSLQKISVVISVYNEEKMIAGCLQSVAWADEVIVVDNGSTDKTVELCKKFKAKIIRAKNNPLLINQSKNYGFGKTGGDFIFSLDADERITPDLYREIKDLLVKNDDTVTAYSMPRKNIIFGKWIQHGLWYPDYQIRLFRKGKAKFPEKHNHESLEVRGKIEKLENHLLHFNYTSVNHYLHKITYYYSDNEAENLLASGKTLNWYEALRLPISDFITNFFARDGYKDGLHGLVLALMQSFYTLVVFAKAWEKQGFWEYNQHDFLAQTEKELKGKIKEIYYWVNKVKNEKSPYLTQLFRKLLDKLLS